MNDLDALPAKLQQWRARGNSVEVRGRRLFTVMGGNKNATPIVFLHGFPTSSFDFSAGFDTFAQEFYAIAHDHLGFGFSDKPTDAKYTFQEQADLCESLWASLNITNAHLVAHDYGVTVASELLARQSLKRSVPIKFRTITLSNASVYPGLTRLRITQRMLKARWIGPLVARCFGPRFFKARIEDLWGSNGRPEQGSLDLYWQLFTRDGGRNVIPKLATYPDQRVVWHERWIGALAAVDVPVHIVWGPEDPIAPPVMAYRLAKVIPGATVTLVEKSGHFPMLSAPDVWRDSVIAFIRKHA